MICLVCPFLCSPSASYQVNYRIQSSLYSWFDEITEKTKCSRSQAFSIWCVSSAITVVLRIVAIAEVFFKGIGIFLSSPSSENPFDNMKRGLYEIFIHTTKNILRTAAFPLEFLDVIIFTLVEPKDCIMGIAEYMRINLLYAEAGEIHTEDHKSDISSLQSVVYPKFLAYQKRMSLRSHIKKVENDPTHNKENCCDCKELARYNGNFKEMKRTQEEEISKPHIIWKASRGS